jgi:hypothetical protein
MKTRCECYGPGGNCPFCVHKKAKRLSRNDAFGCGAGALDYHKDKGLWSLTSEDLDVELFTDAEFIDHAEKLIAEFKEECE